MYCKLNCRPVLFESDAITVEKLISIDNGFSESETNYFLQHFKYNLFQILAVSCDDETFYHDNEFAIQKFVSKIVSRHNDALTFKDGDGNIVVAIMTNESSNILQLRVIAVCREIQKESVEKYGKTMSVGIGNIYNGHEYLNISYIEAEECLSYKFYFKENFTLAIENLSNNVSGIIRSNKEFLFNITKSISKYDQNFTQYLISHEFELYKQFYIAPKKLCALIRYNAEQLLLEYGTVSKEGRFWYNTKKFELDNCSNIVDLKAHFVSFTYKMITYLNPYVSGLAVEVGKAVGYMEENCFDSKLTLTSVCEYLSVSVSYFSVVFKRETGKTFVEYMTEMRLSKANDSLVKTKKKISEIARELGYENPHYFSMVFKKRYNMTPRECRTKGAIQ